MKDGRVKPIQVPGFKARVHYPVSRGVPAHAAAHLPANSCGCFDARVRQCEVVVSTDGTADAGYRVSSLKLHLDDNYPLAFRKRRRCPTAIDRMNEAIMNLGLPVLP
jgi:hypothetical protein